MTISVLFLVGRFLFAVPFVMVGVDRLQGPGSTSGERVWGAVGVLGAAGVVLGLWGDAAALVLAIQVVGMGLAGRGTKDDELVVTAIGLVGGALVVAAVYAGLGDALDLTITDPLVRLDLR